MEFAPFQPLNDLVLVRRVEADTSMTSGGLHVPQKWQEVVNKGIVVDMSPEVAQLDHHGCRTLKEGDRISFGVSTESFGDLLLVRYNDIRGVERAL